MAVDIAGELERLAKLRAQGILSDEEFERAKDAVLAGEVGPSEGDAENEPGIIEDLFGGRRRTLGDAANRYVSFQIVMAIIGLIIFLIMLGTFASKGNSFP